HPTPIMFSEHKGTVLHGEAPWRSRTHPREEGSMADLRVTTTSGADIILKDAVVTAFKQRLRGSLITPNENSYDEARRVWNGNIDRRPGLIARPRSEERRVGEEG